MALIRCEDLSLGYEGRVVVDRLNFQVVSGDYLCIVGENGAGKSTLIKTILGLLKPISGKVQFGEGLSRKEIGYLSQQSLVSGDFPASVKEIVLSGFQSKMGWRPFYSSEEKALAREKLEKMGMAGMEKQCFRELSGGQQQRVLLARALCAGTRLMILDEPVTGLDPAAARSMYGLVQDLNEKEHITIMMISHDVTGALGYAKHILQIGHQGFFGSREEFYALAPREA